MLVRLGGLWEPSWARSDRPVKMSRCCMDVGGWRGVAIITRVSRFKVEEATVGFGGGEL